MSKSKIPEQTIHVFGESHVAIFNQLVIGRLKANLENLRSLPPITTTPFKAYRLGSALAYTWVKERSKTEHRTKFFAALEADPSIKRVMLSGGEIDCRAHIIRIHQETGRSVESVLADTVYQYIAFVGELEKLGLEVILYGPPPTTTRNLDDGNLNYPAFGTWKERNMLTRRFIDSIKLRHDKVVDVFDKFIDEDWRTKMTYLSDHMHLNVWGLYEVLTEMKKMGLVI